MLTACVLAVAWGAPAEADNVTLYLPGSGKVDRQTATYTCAGRRVKVVYINAGHNSLAIVWLAGAPVVMVSVMSGSGARYLGQQYEWWTKEDEASLSDLMKDAEATPVVCRETSK